MHHGESWPLAALCWAPSLIASTPHAPLLTSLELSSTMIVTSTVHFFLSWRDEFHLLAPSHLSPSNPFFSRLINLLFCPQLIFFNLFLPPVTILFLLFRVLLSHAIWFLSPPYQTVSHYEPSSSLISFDLWINSFPFRDVSGNTLYTLILFQCSLLAPLLLCLHLRYQWSVRFQPWLFSVTLNLLSVGDSINFRGFNQSCVPMTSNLKHLSRDYSPEMEMWIWYPDSCLNFHLPTVIFTWMSHRHFKHSTSKT